MKTDILKSGSVVLDEKPDFKLVARKKELSEMMNILGRRAAHNVILVGQGGAGCSSLCLGLQQAKTDTNTPFDILNKRMWWLDSDGLFSDPDKTQELFDKMIRTVSNTADKDTILIIEDTRNFVDSVLSSGNGSFINRIMRNIEQKRFQVIFEVRDTELDMVLNMHSSMRELFTIMDVRSPVGDDLYEIVNTSCINLYKHHGINIETEAIKQAIYLTTTYPGKERSLMRSQPEASLTLIDRALSTYKNFSHSNPPELSEINIKLKSDPENKDLLSQASVINEQWKNKRKVMAKAIDSQTTGENLLVELESDLKKIQDAKDPESSFLMSSREEQDLNKHISEVKKLIQQNGEEYKLLSSEINKNLSLTSDEVFNEFSRLSGIPFDKLNEDESAKLLNLPVALKKRIFGQDHVIDQLSDALLTARTPGLKERGKPDAAFMFCGSSGVGKTELAKALAEILKDDENAMLRFDMSEYSEKNNVTSLIGAPPGYAGYESGGVLTNSVRKQPNSIILFDEIEKAHPSIFDIFLQVLDDGRLTDTQGRTVSFEHTILIFTTNTGAEHMLNPDIDFDTQFQNTLEALSKEYRAEFLNRFGGRENIVAFKILPKEVIKYITRRQLDKVNSDLASADVKLKLTMSDEDVTRLCDYQYKPERGARGIDGIFRTNVYPSLARIIKTGEDCNSVNVTFINNEFNLEKSIKS